jgi:hypothetical protein
MTDDLNTRARVALRGEWLPGMRARFPNDETPRIYSARDGAPSAWTTDEYTAYIEETDWPEEAVPDLDDIATELLLIAVLERRLAPLSVGVWPVQGPAWRVSWATLDAPGGVTGPTRREALVAALEAT